MRHELVTSLQDKAASAFNSLDTPTNRSPLHNAIAVPATSGASQNCPVTTTLIIRRNCLLFSSLSSSTRTDDDCEAVSTMTDQSDRAAGRLGPEPQDTPDTAPDDEAVNDPATPVADGRGELVSLEGNEPCAASAGQGRGDDDSEGEQPEEEEEEEEDEDEDDEDDEDEEPRLKYARLTQSLSGLYRNGDATSAFLVGGDKMVRLFPSLAPMVSSLHCTNFDLDYRDSQR